MYNRKSRVSAILGIITAVLLIGLMVLLPFLPNNVGAENGFAVFFIILFSLFGYAIIYASAIPFAIVALIFGIKMLKQEARKRLISFNVRMLIATCVLLPFLAVGVIGSVGSILESKIGLFPIIYTVIAAVAYIACLITQIVTIVVLKKSPEENVLTVSE